MSITGIFTQEEQALMLVTEKCRRYALEYKHWCMYTTGVLRLSSNPSFQMVARAGGTVTSEMLCSAVIMLIDEYEQCNGDSFYRTDNYDDFIVNHSYNIRQFRSSPYHWTSEQVRNHCDDLWSMLRSEKPMKYEQLSLI